VFVNRIEFTDSALIKQKFWDVESVGFKTSGIKNRELKLDNVVNSMQVTYQNSIPGLVKWDLWWTKRRWGRFFPSTSVSLENLHSTNCSTVTLTYHLGLIQQARSGRSTRDLVPRH
jgi:hypothetical protein